MIALLILSLAGCGGLHTQASPYTGTIEVTEVEISSVLPGRLVEVNFDQGDEVKAGDVVFTLDDATLQAQRDARAAGVEAASAGIDTAKKQVIAVDAQVTYLERELARVKKMQAAGVGTSQQRSTFEGQLAVARAQSGAARQMVAQAEAGKAQAEAALKAADEQLGDATVAAGVDGVVISRNHEPGEVVGPGSSVLTLGDLAHPKLRVYVPLEKVEALSVGDPAQVTIDARPDQPYSGKIDKVATEAEFTPRDILTPEERVKRVFAVDILLDPAPGLLPGIPAEASFQP